MKRPLWIVGTPFAITMGAAFFVDGRSALLLSAALLATAVLAWLTVRSRREPAVILLSMAAAFAVYSLHCETTVAPFARQMGGEVAIEGIVTEVTVDSRAINYTVEARFPDAALPKASVLLRAYGEVAATEGDVIRCRGTVTPLSSGYYRNRGLAARCNLVGELERVESDGYRFARARLAIRAYFRGNLYAGLPGNIADLVGTMVMKIGGEPDASVRSHMGKSGIAHLLAISGLHFSLFTTFILAALRKVGLPRRIPELATLLAGVAFMVTTGFSPSIVRAFVMFAVMTIGHMTFRRGDGRNSLGLALLAISIVRPGWTQGIGMWLSAAAAYGILVSGDGLSRWLFRRLKGKSARYNRFVWGLASAAGVSLGAYLFTLPLLALSNGWISLLAVPANIMIAPFVMPLILGGIACAVLPGGSLLGRVCAVVTQFCARFVLAVSETLAGLPFAALTLDALWKGIFLVAVGVGVGILLWRRPPKRAAAMLAMTAVLLFCIGLVGEQYGQERRVELVTLEGVSGAVVLRGREAVVIGTPDRYEVSALVGYLEYRGVGQIAVLADPAMAAQMDSGLLRLGGRYPIRTVLGPEDAYIRDQAARALKGVPVYSAQGAQVTALGGVEIVADTDTVRLSIGDRALTITGDGLQPADLTPQFEPTGAILYGETRYHLPL
ncbi:ComEC/Rec2 family competence protein [Ruminococcaceae bacterium OttesenSCG-928-L11]|nr:ComEC/Rec2 family competence protein [Ruminococcaceae bacterium OttesenSCG-928-L11]